MEMKTMSGFGKAVSKVGLYIAVIAMVALVSIFDWLLGPQYSFSIFYLVLVAFISWQLGWGAGFAISVLSAFAWIVADYLVGSRYSSVLVPIWNMGVRLSIFLFINQLLTRLKFQLSREHNAARMDALTGVSNVRHFYESAANEVARSARYNHPLSIIYLDIDNFKNINDLKGHPAGDRVLRELARELRENVRKSDIVARVGGDEFVLLFPESNLCSEDSAIKKVVGLLHNVARNTGYHITFSLGVACFLRSPISVEELIKEADDLMYCAKRSGKNRVEKKVIDH
jgi:diguanylate cyclase (GGDEF)-like protein